MNLRHFWERVTNHPAHAERVDAERAAEKLLHRINSGTPVGMTLSDEVKRKYAERLRGMDPAAVRDMLQLKEDHSVSSLALMSILDRYASPSFTAQKIAEHYEYAKSLGWNYDSAAFGFIESNLPDAEWTQGLNPVQERAVLALANSAVTKQYNSSGGSTSHRFWYNPAARECAIERPQDIDRIIAIAQERNPLTIEDYRALLRPDILPPLADGAI
jgi:hypothetical protein